jgi:hypothetical protein
MLTGGVGIMDRLALIAQQGQAPSHRFTAVGHF